MATTPTGTLPSVPENEWSTSMFDPATGNEYTTPVETSPPVVPYSVDPTSVSPDPSVGNPVEGENEYSTSTGVSARADATKANTSATWLVAVKSLRVIRGSAGTAKRVNGDTCFRVAPTRAGLDKR